MNHLIRFGLLSIFCGFSFNLFTQTFGPYRVEFDKKGLISLVNNSTGVLLEKGLLAVNTLDKEDWLFDIRDNRYILVETQKLMKLIRLSDGSVVFEMPKEGFKYHYPDEAVIERDTSPDREATNPDFLYFNSDESSKVVNLKTGKCIYDYDWGGVSAHRTLYNHNLRIDHGRRTQKLIDPDGKVILDSIEDVNEMSNSNYTFRTYKGWGVADKNGKVILPPDNYYIRWRPTCKNYMIVTNAQQKTGVLNYRGEVVIPFEYNASKQSDFPWANRENEVMNDCFLLYKNTGLFILDTLNNVLAETYRYDIFFDHPRFVRLVDKNDKEGIFDTQNKKPVIPIQYDIDNTSGREPMIRKHNVIGAVYNGRWGLINLLSGEIVVPFEYQVMDPLLKPTDVNENTRSITSYAIDDKYFVVRKNGLYGLITPKGEVALPLEYEEIQQLNYDLSKMNIMKVRKDGLYGLLNRTTLEVVAPCVYESISDRLNATKIVDGKLVEEVLKIKTQN